jgi:hypothetical protein
MPSSPRANNSSSNRGTGIGGVLEEELPIVCMGYSAAEEREVIFPNKLPLGLK